jgi:hypothetical protein
MSEEEIITEESFESIYPEPVRGEYDSEEDFQAVHDNWTKDKATHEAPDTWDGQSKPFEKQFDDYSDYLEAVTDWKTGKKISEHFGSVRPASLPKEDHGFDDEHFEKRNEALGMIHHYSEKRERAISRGDARAERDAKYQIESWQRTLNEIPPPREVIAKGEKLAEAFEQGCKLLVSEPPNSEIWKNKAILEDAPTAMRRHNRGTEGLTLYFQKKDDLHGNTLPIAPGNIVAFTFPNVDTRDQFRRTAYVYGNDELRTLASMGLVDAKELIQTGEVPEPPKKQAVLHPYRGGR